jgi:hypothetical protein
MDKTVAAAVITFNAGKDIGDCLSPVGGRRDITVADLIGTGGTVGFAGRHTGKPSWSKRTNQ